MGKYTKFILCMIFVVGCTNSRTNGEISSENAIKIVKNKISKSGYNFERTGIEVIKFKNGVEKGPVRTNLLLHIFPKDDVSRLIKNDFWLVYIYPEKNTIIGGDVYALIDLRTGAIIDLKLGN